MRRPRGRRRDRGLLCPRLRRASGRRWRSGRNSRPVDALRDEQPDRYKDHRGKNHPNSTVHFHDKRLSCRVAIIARRHNGLKFGKMVIFAHESTGPTALGAVYWVTPSQGPQPKRVGVLGDFLIKKLAQSANHGISLAVRHGTSR